MTIKVGKAALSIIKQYEDLELNAYPDPGTKAEPITVGYGTTVYADGRKVRMGDTITELQAVYELEHHVSKKICGPLTNILKDIRLSQNQIDAIISLVYNIGIGAFSKSTLLKHIKSNNLLLAAEQFKVWNKSGGKVLNGLVKRRYTEYMLFNDPIKVDDVVLNSDKEFVSFVYEVIDKKDTHMLLDVPDAKVMNAENEQQSTAVQKQTEEIIQPRPVIVEPPPRPKPSRPFWKLW